MSLQPPHALTRAPLRALVTRPHQQAEDWVARLQAAGIEAQALPLLQIDGAPDPVAVQREMGEWRAGDLVMFVSPNAAQACLACAPLGWQWPAGVRAAATGAGTLAVLQAAGLDASQCVWPGPEATQWDSESLWSRLQHEAWAGQRVWVVRGETGRHWLAEQFQAQGAEVHFLTAYTRRAPQWSAVEQGLCEQALAAPQSHIWLFSSSEGVHHLNQLAPRADWACSQALATHPRIARAARDLGFGRVHELAPGMPALLQWWAAEVRPC